MYLVFVHFARVIVLAQRDCISSRAESKFINGDLVPYHECRGREASPTGEMIKVRNRRRATRACPRQFPRNMSRVESAELPRGVFDLAARAWHPSGPAVALSTFPKTHPPSHAPRTRRETRVAKSNFIVCTLRRSRITRF